MIISRCHVDQRNIKVKFGKNQSIPDRSSLPRNNKLTLMKTVDVTLCHIIKYYKMIAIILHEAGANIGFPRSHYSSCIVINILFVIKSIDFTNSVFILVD